MNQVSDFGVRIERHQRRREEEREDERLLASAQYVPSAIPILRYVYYRPACPIDGSSRHAFWRRFTALLRFAHRGDAMPVDCSESGRSTETRPAIGWSSSPAARPFDRDCLPATAHRREREARKHTLAVNYHSMTSTSGSNRMSYSRHSRGLKQPFWTSLATVRHR